MDVQEMLENQIAQRESARPDAAPAVSVCDGYPLCCATHAQRHIEWLESLSENARNDPWWWQQRDAAGLAVLRAKLGPMDTATARAKLLAQVATGKP